MDGQGSRMSRLELEHMQLNKAQTALEVGVVMQAERTRLTHPCIERRPVSKS